MDAATFAELIKRDPDIQTFLREVAQDAYQGSATESQQYTLAGVDVFIGIAAYALFRWLKDGMDRRRALNEVEILRQQEHILAGLIKDGFSAKEALAVTKALLAHAANRDKNDAVLKAAAGLIGKG